MLSNAMLHNSSKADTLYESFAQIVFCLYWADNSSQADISKVESLVTATKEACYRRARSHSDQIPDYTPPPLPLCHPAIVRPVPTSVTIAKLGS